MSTSWKELERKVAQAIGGRRKVLRGQNFSIRDFDVFVPDFPHWKIDCKYRTQPWKHHGHLHAVAKKYCYNQEDVPILVTKSKGEHGEQVTLRLKDFASIVNALRGARYSIQTSKEFDDGMRLAVRGSGSGSVNQDSELD